MLKAILSLILGLFISSYIYSQQIGDLKVEPIKKHKNHYVLLGAFALVSGAADGFRDALAYRNDRVLDKLNTQSLFFSSESWRNKYKQGNPELGPRFPGSTTFLVFLTDAPHMCKFINNLFTAGSVALQFDGVKKRWWKYAIKGVAYWIVQRIGFSLVYYRF